MSRALWLADALRAGGCTVVEVAGWQQRGRGEMGDVKGVLLHHTAGPRTGDHPSLATVLNGREDLPGPLSQLFLARDGRFHVLAAGKCNHAGVGTWHGVTTGNTSFIGIEAENAGDGQDVWPAVQMEAYIRGVAGILKHLGLESIWAAGHKEYALPKGRKVDPAFDMDGFRAKVAAILIGGQPNASAVKPSNPVHAMLKRDDTGTDVMLLQTKLGLQSTGIFDAVTEAAVRQWQKGQSLVVDGIVGPKTWKSLGV